MTDLQLQMCANSTDELLQSCLFVQEAWTDDLV